MILSAVLTLCRSALHSTSAVVPHGDTAAQAYLNKAAVEVAEDLGEHNKLPQHPQKIQQLLCLDKL